MKSIAVVDSTLDYILVFYFKKTIEKKKINEK